MAKFPSFLLLPLLLLAALAPAVGHGARAHVVRVDTLPSGPGPSSSALFSAEDAVAAYQERLRALTAAASLSLSLSMAGGAQTPYGAVPGDYGAPPDGTSGSGAGPAAAADAAAASSAVDQSSASATPPHQAVLVGVLVATLASVVGAAAAVRSRKAPPAAAGGLVPEVPEEGLAGSSSTEQLVPEGTGDSQDAEV